MPSYSFPNDITHQTVDGEVVAIHFGNGTYYSMRESAAVIWEALAAGQPSEKIREAFANPPDEATGQIEAFLARLQEAQLIAPATDDVASGTPGGLEGQATWATPVLETFTDLSQLLLADPIHDVTEEAWPNLKDPTQA